MFGFWPFQSWWGVVVVAVGHLIQSVHGKTAHAMASPHSSRKKFLAYRRLRPASKTVQLAHSALVCGVPMIQSGYFGLIATIWTPNWWINLYSLHEGYVKGFRSPWKSPGLVNEKIDMAPSREIVCKKCEISRSARCGNMNGSKNVCVNDFSLVGSCSPFGKDRRCIFPDRQPGKWWVGMSLFGRFSPWTSSLLAILEIFL